MAFTKCRKDKTTEYSPLFIPTTIFNLQFKFMQLKNYRKNFPVKHVHQNYRKRQKLEASPSEIPRHRFVHPYPHEHKTFYSFSRLIAGR